MQLSQLLIKVLIQHFWVSCGTWCFPWPHGQVFVVSGQQYNHTTVAEMGDRSAITDMGQNVGAAVSLSVGGANSPSNTMWPAPRPTSLSSGILIHQAIWPKQTWAENCGVCAPFIIIITQLPSPFGKGSWVLSPSNMMWAGPRRTYAPSGILVHPTLWPQYTNVTDRQTGQTMVQ